MIPPGGNRHVDVKIRLQRRPAVRRGALHGRGRREVGDLRRRAGGPHREPAHVREPPDRAAVPGRGLERRARRQRLLRRHHACASATTSRPPPRPSTTAAARCASRRRGWRPRGRSRSSRRTARRSRRRRSTWTRSARRRGLSFANYDYGGFSFEEAVETFGADELFQRINPCWPLKCVIRTPIPDVSALAVVQIIDWAMQNSGGPLLRHRARGPGLGAEPGLAAALHAAGNAFALTRTGTVSGYLDGQHATQASAEFLEAYFARTKELRTQLATIRSHAARPRKLPMHQVMEGSVGARRPGLRHHRPSRRPHGRARPRQQRALRGRRAEQRLPAPGPRAAPERDPHRRRPLELGARHGSEDVARRPQHAVRVRSRGDRREPDAAGPDRAGEHAQRRAVRLGRRRGAQRGRASGDFLPALDAAGTPGAGGAVRGDEPHRARRQGRPLPPGGAAQGHDRDRRGADRRGRRGQRPRRPRRARVQGRRARARRDARRRGRGVLGDGDDEASEATREPGRQAARLRPRRRGDDVRVQAAHDQAGRAGDVRVRAAARRRR